MKASNRTPPSARWVNQLVRVLAAGGPASEALITARAKDDEELLMKLVEAQEWANPDVTSSAKALLASIIANIEASHRPLEEAAAPSTAPMRPNLPPAYPQRRRLLWGAPRFIALRDRVHPRPSPAF